MKRSYPISEIANPVEILRKAGYSYFRDPQTNEESFIIRLTSEFYPRFHLYVINEANNVITFNLHLDQKKPSYGSNNAHSGEYDGPTVAKEMERIHSWVRSMSKQSQRDTSEHDVDQRDHDRQKDKADQLKRWWQKIFG